MSEPRKPVVGAFIKVWLPGETPFAECLAVYDDGTWQGRIDNHLVAQRSDADRAKIGQRLFPDSDAAPLPSLHNYRQGDIVVWKWEGGCWKAAEPPPGRA